MPCEIDGAAIAPDDLVVGDADGVVVVPASVAVATVEAALTKRAAEKEFLAAAAGGMSRPTRS